MNNDTFEYGGYTFQPYAKYTVPISTIEAFSKHNRNDFSDMDIKYNREEFYKKSPSKNCDVFYCLDTAKYYIPTYRTLNEFDEPSIAEHCRARVVSDYVVIHSFFVGEREVIVGEDKNAEYRYFCGYYERNDLFERVVDCGMSNDYLEIMSLFCERATEQVKLFKENSIEGAEILSPDMYRRITDNDNIEHKIVVYDSDKLRREYQSADHQLFYVTHGNGAKPNSIGTKVYGYFFDDKEKKPCYIRRYDIKGIMDKEKLPEWATKKLEAIKAEIKREEREEL